MSQETAAAATESKACASPRVRFPSESCCYRGCRRFVSVCARERERGDQDGRLPARMHSTEALRPALLTAGKELHWLGVKLHSGGAAKRLSGFYSLFLLAELLQHAQSSPWTPRKKEVRERREGDGTRPDDRGVKCHDRQCCYGCRCTEDTGWTAVTATTTTTATIIFTLLALLLMNRNITQKRWTAFSNCSSSSSSHGSLFGSHGAQYATDSTFTSGGSCGSVIDRLNGGRGAAAHMLVTTFDYWRIEVMCECVCVLERQLRRHLLAAFAGC